MLREEIRSLHKRCRAYEAAMNELADFAFTARSQAQDTRNENARWAEDDLHTYNGDPGISG